MVVPKEWEILKIEDCLNIETGDKNTENKVDGGRYPFFVRSQQVERINSYSYDCEAVLTAGDGVGTGKVFHYISGKFDAHQRVYVMTNFKQISGRYFYYYFSYNFYSEVLKYTAKSSVDSVRRDMISQMEIPIPPLEEQVAIATALSDVDDLITLFDKLILKKQSIKQGAMQELLTGKKRLDGFGGEWEEKTLGTCCNILNGDRGVNYPSGNEFIDIGVPFINAGHIKERKISFDNMDYISDEHYQKLSGAKIESGDVLFCLRGSLGKHAKVEFDYAAPASSLCVIRCKNNLINNNFLFHLMGCSIIKNQIENCNTGSSQPNLSAKNIDDFYIPLPSIEEQVAIATILSDMDSEIGELKTKLEKFKQIKQGMMSELLTGRMRFI
ncbi:restriction endonuclease subunit S [Clostridium sp. YIM B02505]|uniref:Restriction endonuclease subunit S n=1 Tax=Clostridium yunnanense TaxID=2800325 RepID=A0ABS1EQ93_9CLOT|nr:restriction endonuclease subunit S [Clostridium yunnanense]MBK1811554.1 restriction endonuclease subunit S [Clostridium yunnanense]